MTNKEHLIDLLMWELEKEKTDCSRELVEKIFDVVNKKDWKVFCSQMGDFDHPGERIQAKKEMEQELEKLNPCNVYCIKKAIVIINFQLEFSISGTNDFYTKHFHTMNQEYCSEE